MAVFLPKGKRIHLKLRKATLNRGGSTRQHNFNVEFNLSEGDDTLTGLPEWIQNAYTNLAKLSNVTVAQGFEIVLTDYTLEFYSTAKNRSKMFPVVLKAKLLKFKMTRTGTDDEDVEVKLTFTILFDTSKAIHDWVFDEDETDFWMATEAPQMDLDLAGVQATAPASIAAVADEDDESDDDDEDDEEDDLDADSDEEDGDDDDDEEEDEQDAQERRKEEAAARTTPLVGLVPRRNISPRTVTH